MPTESDQPEVTDKKDQSVGSQFDETAAVPPDSATLPRFFGPPAGPGEIGTFGPFRLFRELGHGGMGAVYAALHTRLQRRLALKVMLPKFAADKTARERFLREAQAAAQISHDNVVIVYDAGILDEIPYISMQFLEGYSLDEYLTKKGNPSIGQVLRIGRETAAGLAAAHAIGLVHRDIKPANLWLEAPQGRVKVLDFGLAKPVDSQTELTKSGMIVGTPAYMSPEQARGQIVDARTDLFSLGVVLYRLCTGRLPFHGTNTLAVLTALAVDDPAPIRSHNPAVPEALAVLVHQLLAKKPAERPGSAAEVAKRLQAIAAGAAAPVVVTGVPVARPVAAAVSSPMVISSPRNANPFAGLESGTIRVRTAAPAKAPKRMIWWIAAAGAVAAFVMLVAGITVVVKNHGGTETKLAEAERPKAEVPKAEVPKGDKVVEPSLVKSPIIPFELEPGELPKVEPGSALYPSALVQQPAAVKGVRRWTIDTRDARGTYEWMAYSPDGRWIAGALSDGTIRLFDPATRETRRIFATGRHKVTWLTWSADSTHLIALGHDQLADPEGTFGKQSVESSIVVINATTGRLARTFRIGPRAFVHSADLSSDQQSMALSVESPDFRALLLFDLKTGKEVRRWKVDSGSVCFSPEGKRIAVGGMGENLRVFDVNSDAAIVSEKVEFKIERAVWSPDARFLALSEYDGELRIWDITGKKIVHDFGAKAFDPDAKSGSSRVAWSPDGKYLARFTTYKLVVTAGKAPWKVEFTIECAYGKYVSWSPDSKSLALTRDGWADLVPDVVARETVPFFRKDVFLRWGCRLPGKEARIGLNAVEGGFGFRAATATFGFDMVDGRQIGGPEGVVDSILWDADGKRFAFNQGKTVIVRDFPGNNEICRFEDLEARRKIWSEDGRFILTTHRGSTANVRVNVWDAASGKAVGQLGRPTDGGPFENARLLRDGQRLLCEHWLSGNVECWVLQGQKQLWHVYQMNQGPPLAVSPDETAYAGTDWRENHPWISVFSMKDGKSLWKLERRDRPTVPMLWTLDSKHLVIGSAFGTISVLEAADGKESRHVQVAQRDLTSLGWIEPGKTLYAATDAGTAYAVDFATLRRVGGTVMFDSQKRLCVISPDGHFRSPSGGDGNADEELLYVAEFDDGHQETFTPKQFAEKFGWKNDPAKAVLNWVTAKE